MNINLEIAKETEKLTLEGLSFNAALRKAKEMHKEKTLSSTNQSKSKEHTEIFNSIITPEEDIDNGEVFDINTGITKREL